MNLEFAERARALVGTPFRLQGRSARGLDCVGVALESFAIPPEEIRRNYQLRGNRVAEVHEALAGRFRRVPARELRPGDLMLMQVARDQLHIAIRTEAGFVHAHAGLRRVVETPGMPKWPLLGIYRKRRR